MKNTAKFIDIPTYIPHLTTVVSKRVVWHDEKAQATCEKRKLSLIQIGNVFKDPERIVGLSETYESILYAKDEKTSEFVAVIVKEDRYFVLGDDLVVFFTLKDERVQIITAYKLRDKKSWKRLIRFPYAYRAIPEIVGKNFNPESWLPIAITPSGAIAHAIVVI